MSIARRELLLGAGIVVIALSLLIMHQLSLNHTATTITVGGGHVWATDSRPLDPHDPATIGDGHADLVSIPGNGEPAHRSDACLTCSGNHPMVLSCLAALILLAVGLALRRPVEWRGVRLPHGAPLLFGSNRGRTRPPFTLVELSVSRT